MMAVLTLVAPVFGLVLLGALAGRSGYLSDAAAKGLPEFVFRVAMPALLFRIVATAKLPEASPLAVLGAYGAAVLGTWALATLANRALLGRPASDGAAISMGATFSNSVMMGVPLALSAFGPEAGGVLGLLLSCDTPGLWLLAVLHQALVDRGEGRGVGRQIFEVGRRLATNPIVLACALGLVWRVTEWPLPPGLGRVVQFLADAAVPCALFSLGLALAAYSIKGQIPSIVLIAVLKLLVMPLLAFAAATYVFMLPPLAVGVVTLLAAMPVGANAYLFATAYERAPASVSGAIAVSTPLAVLTITALLVLLGAGQG